VVDVVQGAPVDDCAWHCLTAVVKLADEGFHDTPSIADRGCVQSKFEPSAAQVFRDGAAEQLSAIAQACCPM